MENNETRSRVSDIDPDALRQAEFLQTQMILDSLVGKTVAVCTVEDTRITITTTDGDAFYFYGFMGAHSPNEIN